MAPPTRAAASPVELPASRAEAVPARYSNPYLVGLGLGLVLLASFVFMGRGVGATGAISSLAAVTAQAVDAEGVATNDFYLGYLSAGVGGHPMKTWLAFEVLGMMLGGFLSGALASRLRFEVEKGPRISVATRLGMAFVGGGLMGFGSKLARGCTSGQALSGGAVLNVGSWAFMMMVFAGAYALAYFVRKAWR